MCTKLKIRAQVTAVTRKPCLLLIQSSKWDFSSCVQLWSTRLSPFRKLLPRNAFSHCCLSRSRLSAVAHPTSPISYYKQADLGGYLYPTIIEAQLCKQADTDWKTEEFFPLRLLPVLLVCDSVLLPQLCSSEFWHYSVARDCLFILPLHLVLIKYLSMLKETLCWGKKNSVFPVPVTKSIEGIICINSKRSWQALPARVDSGLLWTWALGYVS